VTDAAERDVTLPQPAVPGSGEAGTAEAEVTTAEDTPGEADEAARAEVTTPVDAVPDDSVPDEAVPDEAGADETGLDETGPAGGDAGLRGHDPTGRLLGNRYRLAERIAVGGMGQVWRGTDEILGRPVAVKLLSAKHAADEQFRTRFRAEARYAASLSHPGIAQVYDYGESDQAPDGRDTDAETGLPYLVMELVEGEPLSAGLARDGRMPVGATLDLVTQAARALAVAHAAGIVHRDIKPGNLLIKPDGQVKITDFGIARAALAAHLTQTGMVMGTAQYVSPEQASARPVTAAADIYSLGVVAYECLAGHPPFTAEAPIALALAHVRQQPPPLPDDIPPPVAALIGQMLAKDPADRPASAQSVATRANALKSLPSGQGDPWIIGSGELAGPATWFSDPSPTIADPGQGGPASPADRPATAPLTGAALNWPQGRPTAAGPARSRYLPGRKDNPRRLAVRILAAAAVIMAATAGTLAALALDRHPAPPGTTAGRTASHRAAPGRSHSSAPGLGGGGTFVPTPGSASATAHSPSPSPTASTPSTSPSPTSSPSPSGTPTGSSPASTPPTTPPTSPPTTSTSTGQLPIAGPQTPSTTTQDG
jgi:eukaryotic-like serine/threonine-protein kinase